MQNSDRILLAQMFFFPCPAGFMFVFQSLQYSGRSQMTAISEIIPSISIDWSRRSYFCENQMGLSHIPQAHQKLAINQEFMGAKNMTHRKTVFFGGRGKPVFSAHVLWLIPTESACPQATAMRPFYVQPLV